MLSLYNKHILPKILNSEMNSEDINKYRPDIAGSATGTVLEIGFGSGLNLPHYKNIEKLYALDPSRELFDLAKERIQEAKFQVEYIQASAESMPFAENSIDTVVSTFTMCSIPNLEKALREVRRILTPNGKIYFVEHGSSESVVFSMIQKVVTPISKNFTGGCHLDRDIEKEITRSGLKIEKIEKLREKYKPLLHIYKGSAIKS